MHFLVYIYNYHGGGFRARERASEAARRDMHSLRLPRHPVSCLFCFCFSRACARGLEIRHVTGKRSAVSRMHPVRIHRLAVAVTKKLLRMISMRPRFSGKSLKYLRIYSTFHEYPRRGAKAALLCVAESPSTLFNGDRYESHDLNFLRNKRNELHQIIFLQFNLQTLQMNL